MKIIKFGTTTTLDYIIDEMVTSKFLIC